MIFCVEDDSGIRNLMIYALNAAGFKAMGAPDGNAFFSALEKEKPELIPLDIMLPGEDGIEILKRLKNNSATTDIPVITATAKGTEYDTVTGLDLGADDYLAKPFGMMEMVSRVKAVLRRTQSNKTQGILRIGKLELNVSCHTVKSNGVLIGLTLKEYEMLRFFMENPGIVFTRDQILNRIRDTDYT